ncbi:MLO-like protein 1 [Zea mays]|uniref:MLO-like protein 1 n=1 Tax=Zea mays TaxID=4577 RepID=A0A1D6Q3D2_MAIZE|nr:MLO-like protein 1 [Zea mays]
MLIPSESLHLCTTEDDTSKSLVNTSNVEIDSGGTLALVSRYPRKPLKEIYLEHQNYKCIYKSNYNNSPSGWCLEISYANVGRRCLINDDCYLCSENAFEIAFFFWLLVTYGFNSCIMGKPAYVITRVVISVISQVLCGYSTLPLYALISQMGSSFKKAIFDENVSEGLINWAENARRRNRMPTSVGDNSPIGEGIQMSNQTQRESSMEQGTARLI